MESKTKVKSSNFSKEKLITIPKKDTLRQLNDYRLSSHLCDVFLVAGGREFPAHRAVLSAGGGFFRGLFASNMREQAENKIEIPQVDRNVMDDMLGYIYTGELQLTDENAQLIIMAADFLLLEELKHPVDEFLAQVFEGCLLTPRDSASTLQFAYQYNCSLLEKVVLKQICKNFETITNDSEEVFLEFSAKVMQDILSSDDVVVSDEEVVFTALMRWIRHREEREQLLHQLLTHIRLCSLPEEFIHSVMKDPLIVSSPEFVSAAKDGMNMSYDPRTPNIPHPRDCLDAYSDAILVFPHDHHPYSCAIPKGVWCYIPSADSWYDIPAPTRHGISRPFYEKEFIITVVDDVVENDHIYVDRYDIETNSWSSIIDGWFSPSWQVGIAYLNSIVYVVGGTRVAEGQESGQSTDYVFACDLRSAIPLFRQVASLNVTRNSPYAVSDDQYIYVIGGETHCYEGNFETDAIERYDPESNSWSCLSPIQFSKVDLHSPDQCILVNGRIFVIQRFRDDSRMMFSNLMYDISSDTWSRIPPAPTCMNTLGGLLTYSQGQLYLISGGHSHSEQQGKKGNIIKTVRYDLKENAWSDVISSAELKLDNEAKLEYIHFAGTVVRLRKDFVSTLPLLEDVDPQPSLD